MKRISIVTTVLVSLIIMTLINVPSASALSCAVPASTVRSYFDADAVFSGRPIISTASKTVSPELPANKQVTFKIYRSYKGKGVSGKTITVFNRVWGRNYLPDADYLVYASRGQDGNLYDNPCGRTKFLSAAKESLGDIMIINIVQLAELVALLLFSALALIGINFVRFRGQPQITSMQEGRFSKPFWGKRYLSRVIVTSLIILAFLYLVPLLEKSLVKIFLKPPY